MNKIIIKGARVHNLQNIDVTIPKNSLVVITGLSGSGKSSLAFDTIYAEGQRRYVESLSSYARQFLGQHSKPDIDHIEGLSPAIAIDQRTTAHNPRSTVGTMTDIYDYLRILFARIGIAHCPRCHEPLTGQTKTQIINQINKILAGHEILIMAPVIKNQPGDHQSILSQIKTSNYQTVRIDNTVYSLPQISQSTLAEQQPHSIEIIIDQLKLPLTTAKNCQLNSQLIKAITTALDLSNGAVIVHELKRKTDHVFYQNLTCPKCNFILDQIDPRIFSFNSPKGACPDCKGLGTKLNLDPDLVIPNPILTLAEGVIRPWTRLNGLANADLDIISRLGTKYDFNINTPWKTLSSAQQEIILNGADGYPGVFNNILTKYEQTNSEYTQSEITKYMRVQTCPTCNGARLNPISLGVLIAGQNISQLCQLTVDQLKKFLQSLSLSVYHKKIADPLINEIVTRLNSLRDVGLKYLSLNRTAGSLSGGESQRARLATQINSGLSGVIYILDEPSIGLHQRDNYKLIKTLTKLKSLNNTVIVVEHDQATIEAADWVIDIGPGAGKHGGRVIAEGPPQSLVQNRHSLTADYLSRRKLINTPVKYRPGINKHLQILGAQEFNLKNINVAIPLAKLVCITGVSGSGKSTLVTDILSKSLAKRFYKAKDLPGKHKQLKGLEYINKVVTIDQSPIGRTPRSNPATYTGVFTHIRDLFTQVPEARIRGFSAGHFSFNVKGAGRCPTCEGDGSIKIEMHLLPDVYVICDDCQGKRYQPQVLEIYWNRQNIAEVLAMTVEDALTFFKNIPAIYNKLKVLDQVGLGYIHLDQPATTLSGGEAQRVKLATELSRRATGRTLYILDEPTTGLHFDDIKKLLNVLNKLVDKGNTVLVIEHNLDVIKCADWVIDLGPEGGDKGGQIVAQGTPPEVAQCPKSYTGKFLKKVLKK